MRSVYALYIVEPSGMPFRGLSLCQRACRAVAWALDVARHSVRASHVQTSCLPLPKGRADDARRRAGDGPRRSAGPPEFGAKARSYGGRQDKRSRHAVARKAGLHMGVAQHAPGVSACRECPRRRMGVGESACFVRLTALMLEGAVP